MHAVEVPDRHHGASQRTAVDPLRATVRNMEVFCWRVGPAHRIPGRLHEIAVKDVHISCEEHWGRGYGYRAVNKLSN
jgi:hypothetical protein